MVNTIELLIPSIKLDVRDGFHRQSVKCAYDVFIGCMSLDVAVFYNYYGRPLSADPGRPFFESDPEPPHLVIPLIISNSLYGKTYGGEASANWEITKRWKMRGGYSYLTARLNTTPTDRSITLNLIERGDPRHQFQIQNSFKLPRRLEVDTALFRVSRLPASQIPGYTRLDTRLGWKVRESFELSLGLQNLLDDRHLEFNGFDSFSTLTEVERSIYGKATWRF